MLLCPAKDEVTHRLTPKQRREKLEVLFCPAKDEVTHIPYKASACSAALTRKSRCCFVLLRTK